eukprot:1866538-Pyramimonas_sp.AAC.1
MKLDASSNYKHPANTGPSKFRTGLLGPSRSVGEPELCRTRALRFPDSWIGPAWMAAAAARWLARILRG